MPGARRGRGRGRGGGAKTTGGPNSKIDLDSPEGRDAAFSRAGVDVFLSNANRLEAASSEADCANLAQKPASAVSEKFCFFCNRHERHSRFNGDVEFYDVDGIRAHHLCMLFSAGLPQDGDKKNSLGGFDREKIVEELRRVSKLKCSHCSRRGGGMGCRNKKCLKTYHYPCGLEANALLEYSGDFSCCCEKHRPKVTFTREYLETEECVLCYEKFDVVPIPEKADLFEAEVPFSIVKMKCCKKALLHRECLVNMAINTGYHFRCPLCNNADKKEVKAFQKGMRLDGIFVPRKDAHFEQENVAESGADARPLLRCEVEDCLFAGCNLRRLKNHAEDLSPCAYECGRAVHLACVGQEDEHWLCSQCDGKPVNIPRESFRRIPSTLPKIYADVPQGANDEKMEQDGEKSILFELMAEKFADRTTGIIPPLPWPERTDENNFPFTGRSRFPICVSGSSSPVKHSN